MSLATLFGKLQEHEMELQRLNQNEETDKRKRSNEYEYLNKIIKLQIISQNNEDEHLKK